MLRGQITTLEPLLDVLPLDDGDDAETEPVIPDNRREIYEECLSLHNQLVAQQQLEAEETVRVHRS